MLDFMDKKWNTVQTLLQCVFIFSLPMQFGPHFWQKTPLLYGFRIDYLSGYIYLADILAIIIITFNWKNIIEFILNKWWGRVSMFFLIFNLIQLVWVESFLAHLFWSVRIFLCIMSMYCIYININKLKKFIYWIVVLELIFLIIISLWQINNAGSIGGFLYFLGERRMSIQTPGVAKAVLFGKLIFRPYTIFSHPNVMAGYVLLCGYVAYVFCGITHRRLKILMLLIMELLLVVLSYSQLGLFVLAVFIFLNWYFTKIPKTNNKIIILTPFLFTVISPILLQLFNLRPDITMRNYIFTNLKIPNTWELLFGKGWFGSLFSRVSFVDINLIQPIHNVAWEIGISLGLVPFMLGLFFLYKKIKTIDIGRAIAPLTSLFILTSFDHYVLTQPQGLYGLGFFLAALVAFLYNKN